MYEPKYKEEYDYLGHHSLKKLTEELNELEKEYDIEIVADFSEKTPAGPKMFFLIIKKTPKRGI